jgi:hypothetical protein
MSGPRSAKDLLRDYNQEQYKKFVLEGNENASLLLPQVSSVPGVGASKRRKISYTKQTFSDAPGVKMVTGAEAERKVSGCCLRAHQHALLPPVDASNRFL